MTTQKQKVMMFSTYTRDHACVWQFMEFMPAEDGSIDLSMVNEKDIMIDREGTHWYSMRWIYNTTERAKVVLDDCADDSYSTYELIYLERD